MINAILMKNGYCEVTSMEVIILYFGGDTIILWRGYNHTIEGIQSYFEGDEIIFFS